MAGLGFLFRSRNLKAKILKFVVRQVLKVLLRRKNSQLILQNPDDAAAIKALGIDEDKIHLIRGAGVDVEQFKPQLHEARPFTVLIATRMLWDKGVGEFVAAAKICKAKELNLPFVLVGSGDAAENPNSISEQQLQAWHDSGVVE